MNVPPFLDKVMLLVRPFMKSEIRKMVSFSIIYYLCRKFDSKICIHFLLQIHTHVPNSSTLFDFVPKDILPVDYGGEAGNVADIKKWWMDKIMEHREYLMDESRWTVDDTKRSGDNNNSEKKMFGMEGSFRSLAID